VLFAFTSNPVALMIIELLDVITGAVLGVLTAVVIADVTKGTGRFNLAQGMFGTVMGVGASLSPTLTGLIVDHFGRSADNKRTLTTRAPERARFSAISSARRDRCGLRRPVIR
jgi:MFS family permease